MHAVLARMLPMPSPMPTPWGSKGKPQAGAPRSGTREEVGAKAASHPGTCLPVVEGFLQQALGNACCYTRSPSTDGSSPVARPSREMTGSLSYYQLQELSRSLQAS